MSFFCLKSDLSPGPSPEGEGSKYFSEFLGDKSPKNSELKDFSPFPSGKGAGGLGLAQRVATWVT
jgi:hypothetical protein